MRLKHYIAHMKAAKVYAECSSARRLKVGCVIVKDGQLISIGYNGMPSGWDNECENWVQITNDNYDWVTKPEVLHAESNAIAKLAKSNSNGLGADLFVTHSPCLDCAKLIYQSGIRRVFYGEQYRDSAGIDFLKQCYITVERLDENSFN